MDDLTAPLGLSRPPPRMSSPWRMVAILLGVACVGAVGIWAVLTNHLFRELPVAAAVAPVEVKPEQPSKQSPSVPNMVTADPGAAGSSRTVTIIDGMSGKRQEVTIGSPNAAPNAPAGKPPR